MAIFLNAIAVSFIGILVYLCLPLFNITFLYAAQGISDTSISSSDSLVSHTNSLDSELNLFSHFVIVIIGLAIVIILLILTVWVLKQILRLRGSGIADGAIEVLVIKYLEQKKAVALIRVLKRILIVGIAENSVTTLGELSSEEIGNLNLDKKTESGVFGNILKKFWGKKSDYG